jgi:hypothetical protein
MYEMERDAYTEAHRGGSGILYCGLWLLWVVVNIVAFGISESLGEAVEAFIVQAEPATTQLLSLDRTMHVTDWNGYIAAVVGGIVAGVVLGAGQGLILAPYLKWKGFLEWLVATTIGRAVRWIALFVIGQQLVGLVADKHIVGACFVLMLLIGMGCIGGGALGYAQSVVLRRRVHHSEWWILANLAGPVAAAILIVLGLYIEDQNVFRYWTNPIMAIITACATGVALVDLLRHPTPHAEWASGLRWRRERTRRSAEY